MRLEKTLALQNRDEALQVFGTYDRYLKLVRRAFHVDVFARGEEIHIHGPAHGVEQAHHTLQQMLQRVRAGGQLELEEVERILSDRAQGHEDGARPARPQPMRTVVEPKTDGQQKYIDAMESHEIVFSIGPAGTGKTYLAVAQAVKCLRASVVRKIVLARPAVEAGEKLGFLPGDYQAKVNPYLRPLYDALDNMMDFAQIKKLTDSEIVEVVPLAYMRGRTLDNSFIILDEAQNTTHEQMKMFLTRMGNGSRIVVTGDVTQIDLPPGTTSGLVEAQHLLKSVQGLQICYLTQRDIVRHPLVQRIVDAYEEHSKRKAEGLGKKD